MPRRSRVPFVFAALVLVLPGPAQTAASPKAQAAFEKTRRKVLWKAGQRHIHLGMWARKLGINAQATEQFMLVREVSDGINTGGDFLLGLQRQYGEDFWKQHLRRVPARYLAEYDRRARDLLEKDRAERFGLAHLARRLKLTETAAELYERLLRSSESVIAFDDKGRIPLEGGTIPADYAARYASEAIEIDGVRQLRDEVLAAAPAVAEVHVAADARLRVRSEISVAHAAELHGLLSKLLPQLEEAVGGTPTRKLEVFVFAAHERFRDYVQGAGYGATSAHGLMDPAGFAALVSAEGRSPDVVQAIALHELVHLYDYAVSRAVFPAWYTEGFAETYGGIGTFSLADGKLEVGGVMAAYRLKPLLESGGLLPLHELLAFDRERLLRTEPEAAARFYAQAWAFLRYLRRGAGTEVAERLAIWEARCRGAAVGAEVGKPRARSQKESAALFEAAFATWLPELETGFRRWLADLVGS